MYIFSLKGTTLIPPKSEGSSSSGKNDRAKGSHNQYGTRQTDFDAVSSFSKSSKSAGLSISRTGNSHHNTQIHSEHSIQDSVSDDKKCLDAKSANSGRGSLSSSMMPPPPKLKSISSNSCSSDSSAASSISSHAAGGNSDKHSSVQHPAIVGASGVGRDNQVQPQNLLNNATDLLQSKRDQQHQILSRVASSKSRQVLINPNTGMMESGPSESSSEGENDVDGSGTSAGATGDKRKSGGVFSTISGSGFAKNQHSSNSSSNAERALKVKLKLPSSSQQQVSQQPGESSVSSPLNVNNAVNNVSSSKQLDTPHNSDNKKRAIEPISEHSNTNSSGSERVGSLSEAKTKAVEPKLPKLILSVREKKVKLAQESAAAASSKPHGASLPHSLSSFKTIGDRKKARKLTTSDDEGSESEDIEDDDGGDDYHPTDEEEEEEEEDVEDEDLDEPDLDDDDDEALEIATARAKNLRMMQLHTSSSSPSRTASKSSLGSGDSLHNVLDKESSRDSKVQNRTTGLSQASEKHLKSLETSRSKFLRMKQQQKNKKQTMQLNQTPKIDLWKDSLNIKDRKFNEHVKDLIDKKGNISKLSNAKTEDKHSQEIEGRLSLNIREAKEDAQMTKGNYLWIELIDFKQLMLLGHME